MAVSSVKWVPDMRIGYSFWGFLGLGIVDTPDGGRSHRLPWVRALARRYGSVVFLQQNRDADEADEDFSDEFEWDSVGYPDIDLVFLEWRWPIAGRSVGTACGSEEHTCDFHRQSELIEQYSQRNIPIYIWDKDQQLPLHSRLRKQANVHVLEPGLAPRPGARSLLFPFSAPHVGLMCGPPNWPQRPRDVVYVGNQYDRDDEASRFLAPVARSGKGVHVFGKWSNLRSEWSAVRFHGRIAYGDVGAIYGSGVATVLMSPPRYRSSGQITQRLFESVAAGCLPLIPSPIAEVRKHMHPGLIVRSYQDVVERVDWARSLKSGEAEQTWSEVVASLSVWNVDRQVSAFGSYVREDQACGL